MKTPLKPSFVLLLALLPFASCTEDEDDDIAPEEKPGTVLKADAGPDQTITSGPNSVLLDGSLSTYPQGATVTYEWSKASGPDAFRIVDERNVKAQANDLVNSTYRFVLSVRDVVGKVSKDTMQVTVQLEFVEPSCNNSDRPLVNARLVPVGTLSEARMGMATAASGSKIVFAGASLSGSGVNGYGSSRVDIYDTATNTWTTAELSEARSDLTAVAAGNKLFFAGGRLGDGAFDQLFSTVDIYDVGTGTWTVASLSQPRAYIAAAAVGNKVFFAGGEKDWSYNVSDRVDIYDLSTNQWSTTSLSEPRSFISAVALHDKVYFAGGQKEDPWYTSPSNKIEVYDATTNSWSTSLLKQPMGFIAARAVADNIFWMGGCTMEKRNVITGESTLGQLFKPGPKWLVQNHAVVLDNKLLFFRNEGEDAHKFDIYDLSTDSWSIGVLPQDGIKDKSIVAVNNTVYMAGGIREENPDFLSNQVWKLEF